MNKSIKLLSLNVSIFDENNEKLIGFLKKINPDIVCLQEVTRKVEDSAKDDFISKNAIDNATPKLTHPFYAPNWTIRYFELKNFHGQKLFKHHFGGFIEIGNYVKSKFEIIEGQGVFVQGSFSFINDRAWQGKNPGQEPRLVQLVDLKVNNRGLRILNYHGIWSREKTDTDRTISASRKIVELASHGNQPTIICGDFNLFPDTESIKILKDKFISLVDKFDIKTTRPKSNEHNDGSKRNVVDYIFVSKEIFVKKFEVIESDVSDHLPLLLEFDMLGS